MCTFWKWPHSNHLRSLFVNQRLFLCASIPQSYCSEHTMRMLHFAHRDTVLLILIVQCWEGKADSVRARSRSMKYNRIPHTKSWFNIQYIPSSGNIKPNFLGRLFFLIEREIPLRNSVYLLRPKYSIQHNPAPMMQTTYPQQPPPVCRFGRQC